MPKAPRPKDWGKTASPIERPYEYLHYQDQHVPPFEIITVEGPLDQGYDGSTATPGRTGCIREPWRRT
jgi:hypothetical protein